MTPVAAGARLENEPFARRVEEHEASQCRGHIVVDLDVEKIASVVVGAARAQIER
jgi:hypothetical protein